MIQHFKQNVGEVVVLDTRSSWMYIGTLESVFEDGVWLTDVDVQDNSDSRTSKDRYIYESRDTGIKMNRDRVFVSLDYIVSFSKLIDIKTFK